MIVMSQLQMILQIFALLISLSMVPCVIMKHVNLTGHFFLRSIKMHILVKRQIYMQNRKISFTFQTIKMDKYTGRGLVIYVSKTGHALQSFFNHSNFPKRHLEIDFVHTSFYFNIHVSTTECLISCLSILLGFCVSQYSKVICIFSN